MAFNANYNKSSKKNPTIKLNEGKDAVFGIYLAEVVSTKDVSRTGRVRVFIPAISKDKNSTAGYFDAIWTSPFAGSTDPRQVGKDINVPEESMSSYGFWATVPDNGNLVLVAFGDGNTKYPLVMSCLFSDKFNFAIPGQAGNKSYQAPNLDLPTVEKNKRTEDINHNDTFRPIQHTLSESIVKQGLAFDPIRGAGKATARRESPSEVFGILTPGPRSPENFNYRLGGHQLVMDDNLDSRQIRIRTAQGNQLLLDDTSGMIYMINRDGTVWWEMTQTGDFHIFAEGNLNIRSKKNLNIRADLDVNIEAGQDVNIKAAGDNQEGIYQGEGTSDLFGNMRFEAKGEMHQIAEKNTFQTSVQGEHHINAAGSLYQSTGDSYDLTAQNGIKADAGSGGVSFKAAKDIILETAKNIVEKGTQVLMNSGGGSAEKPDIAANAIPKDVITHVDQAPEAPGYDREKEAPVFTSGLRKGQVASVASITTVMVTAEPFEGHGLPDPSKDDQSRMVPDESIKQKFKTEGQNGMGNNVDVNEPAGYAQGDIIDGKPEYTSPANVVNNFTFANNKKVMDVAVAAAKSMTNSTPSLRSPLITAQGSMALGTRGKINKVNAAMGAMAFDLKGIPMDMQKADVLQTRNMINQATQQFLPGGLGSIASADPTQLGNFSDALSQEGISMIPDGNSLIFNNRKGHNLIMFAETGLGPTGDAMLTQSALAQQFPTVAAHVQQPVSNNQASALLMLADHIGPEAFAKSPAVKELNKGNYKDVPRNLMAHTQQIEGGKPVTRPDHEQKMQYVGELFRTPDGVQVDSTKEKVTYKAAAAKLIRQRRNLAI